MKTTKIFLLAALTLLLGACSQTDDMQTAQPVKTLKFKATIGSDDALTRALAADGDKIVASWAENEEVAMIYTISGSKKLTKATVTTVNASGATIEAEVEDGITEGQEVTLVYPYRVAQQDVVDDVLVVATQNGDLTTIANNFDVCRGTGAFHVDGETVTLQEALKLSALNAICKFTLQDEDGDPLPVKTFEIYNTAKGYTMAKLELAEEASTFYLAVLALTSDYNTAVSFTAETEGEVTYTGSGTTKLTAGKYYTPTVKLEMQAPVTIEAVDLGLTSGTRWANMNIGAKSETDAGLYFAWGDIQGYRKGNRVGDNHNFSWDNDIHKGTTDKSYANTTYTNGGLEVLKDEDDAATQLLGSEWSIPTKEQWQELIKNTTMEWTTNYNDTGIKGVIIKGERKLNTTTYQWEQNSIFIPANGYFEGQSLLNEGVCAGTWAKQLAEDEDNLSSIALCSYFDKDLNENKMLDLPDDRWKGYPIRAVRNPSVSERSATTTASMNVMGDPVDGLGAGEW